MLGCHRAFAIGACRMITDLRIRVPMSHIQTVVGMFSVLVANRVLDLSKVNRFVPVFISVLLGGAGLVGGQID